jgi:hypothetical protein
MLSNDKIDDLDLARAHIAFVVGQRRSMVVTIDWTECGLPCSALQKLLRLFVRAYLRAYHSIT